MGKFMFFSWSIIVSLLIGCGDEVKSYYTVNISGEKCEVELASISPSIYCFNDLLVTTCSRSNPLFRVYKDNQEVYSYGAIGRGPKEFLSFVVTSVLGDTLLINDTHLKALIYLKIGDDGDGQYVKEVKRLTYKSVKSEEHNLSQTIGRMVKVNDNYFAGSAMWSDTSLFGLYDSRMNFVRYFGELPFEADLGPLSLMTDFDGIIRSRNNTLIYSMLNFAYITAYHIGDDGEIRSKWSDEIFPMEFEIQRGGVKLYREKAFGMCRGMYLTENYIYI